jgi:hypothetical protein
VLRVLDELPPATGTIVGTVVGATVGTTASVDLAVVQQPLTVDAPPGPLGPTAERYLAMVGGAILAADEHSAAADVIFEARAYGATPMIRDGNHRRDALH